MCDLERGVPAMSKPKTIIWHIGFRKAGTTTMQHLLRTLPAESYPDLLISARDDLTDEWRRGVKTRLETNHQTGRDEISVAIRNLAATLRDAPQTTILISDENLFALNLFATDGTHFFDWAADILAEADREFADFENIFVAYVRPVDAWLKSVYSQELRRGRVWHSYDEWIKQLPRSFDWERGLEALRTALSSRLEILPLASESGFGLPLGGRLLAMAGVPREAILALPPIPRLNQRLPYPLMLAFRALNYTGRGSKIRKFFNTRAQGKHLRPPQPTRRKRKPRDVPA
jgi:hypothetical protein